MVVTSNIKATFPCDSQRVWEVVTSLANYSWRSDIERIEVISDTQFVEITKSGYRTIFTITRQEPFCLWEFDIENDNMKGHWVGAFSGNEKTATIDFTEHIEPKKWFPKLLVRIYLKYMQVKYVRDLREVLKRIRL